MGWRQHLTVRKRRCNERHKLKARKQELLDKKALLVQCVYGGKISITPGSYSSRSNDDNISNTIDTGSNDCSYQHQGEEDANNGPMVTTQARYVSKEKRTNSSKKRRKLMLN